MVRGVARRCRGNGERRGEREVGEGDIRAKKRSLVICSTSAAPGSRLQPMCCSARAAAQTDETDVRIETSEGEGPGPRGRRRNGMEWEGIDSEGGGSSVVQRVGVRVGGESRRNIITIFHIRQ